MPEGKYPAPEPTDDERLQLPDGREVDTHYLSRALPRINRRPHYAVKVAVHFNLPDLGLDVIEIPLRIRVQSDDLPDELPEGEYVIDYPVRAARRPSE